VILYLSILQLLAGTLLITVLYLLAPRLALGGVLFGVTVPEGFATTATGRAILHRYRVQVLLAGALGLSGVLLLGAVAPPHASAAALLLGAALSTAAWLAARARTRPHAVAPSPVRRAGLGAEPPGPNRWLDLVPFLLLALVGVTLAAGWDRLPERFPVHWRAAGVPDRWANRTPWEIFSPLVMGAALCLAMLGLRAALVAFSPLRAGDPRAVATRRLLSVVLLGVSFLLALVFCAVALTPFLGGPGLVLVAAGVGFPVLLVTLAVWSVRLARLPSPATGDGTPDHCWKAGLFYVNPDDPAVFVPKRSGLGYTVNFGRPGGWLALLLMLAVPLLVVLLTRSLGR
jgi:uncharacterized membrane protein